jgi:hypothetical protein
MLLSLYKIAAICSLVISGGFVIWTLRLGKEGIKPTIKLVSILIFGIFLAIFPGGVYLLFGVFIVLISLILICYELFLKMPTKNPVGKNREH